MSNRERFVPQPVGEVEPNRAVLVGVDRGRGWGLEESLAELERLADTAGFVVVGTLTQKMQAPDSRTFIGSGKLEEVESTSKDLRAKTVVFDDDLTPSQQANIEDGLPDIKVLDRTALILDIFAMHAVSREGKLQVDLAQLQYALPRLRGMWGHLVAERLGGGRGTRFGAGESQLESDRRMTRHRISELNRELKHVSAERELQRKARVRSGIFRVALVGYTNAGKSTTLNALTDAGVLVADQLFATLDATTRTMDLAEGRKVTVTDTVGFIHKLPHSLVEAFKSTLDEVREADLLLHVVDAAHQQARDQISAVQEVLGEIGAADRPTLLVLNKADALEAGERAAWLSKYPHAVVCSAVTGEGLEELRERVGAEAARQATTLTLLVPYDRGDIVALAHERAHIVSEEHIDSGTRLVVRAPSSIIGRLDPFAEKRPSVT
ncbi:MAG: GTPase HflX [Coriobacteriia bacterium]|nr:GTPase HflX [Coriobacteriia bacterium]